MTCYTKIKRKCFNQKVPYHLPESLIYPMSTHPYGNILYVCSYLWFIQMLYLLCLLIKITY